MRCCDFAEMSKARLPNGHATYNGSWGCWAKDASDAVVRLADRGARADLGA